MPFPIHFLFRWGLMERRLLQRRRFWRQGPLMWHCESQIYYDFVPHSLVRLQSVFQKNVMKVNYSPFGSQGQLLGASCSKHPVGEPETAACKCDTHSLFIHTLVVTLGPTEMALGIIISCLVSCAWSSSCTGKEAEKKSLLLSAAHVILWPCNSLVLSVLSRKIHTIPRFQNPKKERTCSETPKARKAVNHVFHFVRVLVFCRVFFGRRTNSLCGVIDCMKELSERLQKNRREGSKGDS